MEFTKELQEHLYKMGWTSNRKITAYDSYMEQYNYPEFIREYGNLKIKDLNIEGHLKDRLRTSFNPLDSDGMDTNSVAKDYAIDIGRKLYVLGLYSPENFDIAADENGGTLMLKNGKKNAFKKIRNH